MKGEKEVTMKGVGGRGYKFGRDFCIGFLTPFWGFKGLTF